MPVTRKKAVRLTKEQREEQRKQEFHERCEAERKARDEEHRERVIRELRARVDRMNNFILPLFEALVRGGAPVNIAQDIRLFVEFNTEGASTAIREVDPAWKACDMKALLEAQGLVDVSWTEVPRSEYGLRAHWKCAFRVPKK